MYENAGRKQAQQKVDRIRAFRHQLAELTGEGVLDLTPDQRVRLDSHLDRTLAELAERFDVDVSDSQKRLSLGMRVVSALGGLAFCMALFLFFYRFWGMLTTAVQVGLLAGAPVAGLAAMEVVSRRRAARYYSALLGVVVVASFILNLAVIGVVFNVVPTPHAFLAFAVFALVVAYTHDLKLPLAAGLVSLMIWAASVLTLASGVYWASLEQRPEHLLPGGAAVAAAPLLLRHRGRGEFLPVYRLVGLLFVFVAVEWMMHAGGTSYLPLPGRAVSAAYQVTAFLLAGLTVWTGIRRNLGDLVNLGSAFFTLYLFDRLINWWWDWMPRYLFFLIIGAIAVTLLTVFRRVRMRLPAGRTS